MDKLQGLFPARGFPVATQQSTAVVKATEAPVVETKAANLLPQGAYGSNYIFFSPDGGVTMYDLADGLGQTALAFTAYWYVATRWRAMKIAEAPLMVVEQDKDDGSEEWLPDHDLAELLDNPSPDWDMGEMVEITSHYLDNTGAALWVMQRDNAQRIARITPFHRNEFEPHRDASRLYAYFTVQTIDGMRDIPAENCCFFKDWQRSTQLQSTAWTRGHSRLDIALQWLRLGDRASKTIHDLLANSVWPSAVAIPDKDWDPDKKTLEFYKEELQRYAASGNKGKPFVALGGGDFKPLSSSIKDLVPSDVLNRVESVIAAVSGVPAIVLQFQIGIENSPWSQMPTARKMAYDDVVVPSWKKLERVMTRQILRPEDPDPTHFIRFDRTQGSLNEKDQLQATQIAVLMGRAASLNERRVQMGLEPNDDPKADDIPELTQPSMADLLAATTDAPPLGNKPIGSEDAKPTDPNAAKDPAAKTRERLGTLYARKFKAASLMSSFRSEAETVWHLHVHQQLEKDAAAIADIVMTYLQPPEKALQSKARGAERAMSAVNRYLNEEGKASWLKTVGPLAVRSAQRAGAVVGADMGVNFNTLNSNLIKFAQRETGLLITSVSNTTKSLVSDIIQGGIDAKATKHEIAALIRESTGFSKARSMLIARTETTRVFNGAPTESLAEYGKSAGVNYLKTWSGVLDDRERDEHVALEGETVSIDETFSNDLDYPSEPNCRCTVLYSEEPA